MIFRSFTYIVIGGNLACGLQWNLARCCKKKIDFSFIFRNSHSAFLLICNNLSINAVVRSPKLYWYSQKPAFHITKPVFRFLLNTAIKCPQLKRKLKIQKKITIHFPLVARKNMQMIIKSSIHLYTYICMYFILCVYFLASAALLNIANGNVQSTNVYKVKEKLNFEPKLMWMGNKNTYLLNTNKLK